MRRPMQIANWEDPRSGVADGSRGIRLNSWERKKNRAREHGDDEQWLPGAAIGDLEWVVGRRQSTPPRAAAHHPADLPGGRRHSQPRLPPPAPPPASRRRWDHSTSPSLKLHLFVILVFSRCLLNYHSLIRLLCSVYLEEVNRYHDKIWSWKFRLGKTKMNYFLFLTYLMDIFFRLNRIKNLFLCLKFFFRLIKIYYYGVSSLLLTTIASHRRAYRAIVDHHWLSTVGGWSLAATIGH